MIAYEDYFVKEVIVLAGKCEICGKMSGFGHNVSHSKRRTNRTWAPNIQKSHVAVDGTLKQLNVCTRCMRTLQKKPRLSAQKT